MRISRNMKKVTSSLIIASIITTSAAVPFVTSTYAQALSTLGTPYTEQGQYDVTVPHIVINQLYGAGLKTASDSYFSHGFIELYNPTSEDVDLTGWSIQYADRGTNATTGPTNDWEVFPLSGTIKANHSYLIVGKETDAGSTLLLDLTEKADLVIDRFINNKGMKVALVQDSTQLTIANPFEDKPTGYVDLVGTASNDSNSEIDGYETDYPTGDLEGTSKKKAILRKLAKDQDNNKTDFMQIDYSGITTEIFEQVMPRGSADGAWTPTYEPEVEEEPTEHDSNLGEELLNQLELNKIASYSVGYSNPDGGVAEIVKYNKDNGKFYLVNGSTTPPTLEIVPLAELGELEKEISINIQALAETEGFVYGDLTSVNVNTVAKEVVVSVAEAGTDVAGKVLVLDYDGQYIKEYEVGVQPDMVTRTEDGRYILTANEGEPREAGVDPKGSISVIDTTTDVVTNIYFDDESLIDDSVIIRGASDDNGQITTQGTKADAITDLEPEYIALSKDGKLAYVALQENNAIATINIESKTLLSVKGLGFKDFNDAVNALDVHRDDKILLENVPFKGMYMPDGIATFEVNDTTYIVTANEGDATGWPERTNESEVGKLKAALDPDSPAAKFLATQGSKYDKLEAASGMPTDSIYVYGARSFSIWNSDTMTQVYDSGSEFERVVGQRLPEYFNASNSNATLDSRSTKKGPEPEDVKVGKVGSQTLAFIGLERIGGVAVYNVTKPDEAYFVNYSNTRDFSTVTTMDSAPEGLEFISASDSITGKPLLLVAFEVSGTVGVYELDIPVYQIGKESYELKAGSNLDMGKEVTGVEEGEVVQWVSSNPTIATVNEAGLVSARSTGTVTISVLSEDGYAEATTTIRVLRNNDYVNNEGNETLPEEPNQLVQSESSNNSQFTVKGTAANWLAQEGSSISLTSSVGTIIIDKNALKESIQKQAIANDTEIQAILEKNAAGAWVWSFKAGNETIDIPVQLEIPIALPQNAATAGLVGYKQLPDGSLEEITLNFVDGKANQVLLNGALSGSYIVTYVSNTFNDIANAASNEAIHYLLTRGIVTGLDSQTFAPGEALSRAQLITVLARIAGASEQQQNNSFSDVPANAYYNNAVQWALNNNLANGISDQQFGPHQEITREQMAVFVYRYMKLNNIGMDNTATANQSFTDETNISVYAREAVEHLNKVGLLEGYTNAAGNVVFAPKQALTREEGMVILYRMLQLK